MSGVFELGEFAGLGFGGGNLFTIVNVLDYLCRRYLLVGRNNLCGIPHILDDLRGGKIAPIGAKLSTAVAAPMQRFAWDSLEGVTIVTLLGTIVPVFDCLHSLGFGGGVDVCHGRQIIDDTSSRQTLPVGCRGL